jgi:hypothetical protein
MKNDMLPLRSGTRRNWIRLPFFPFLLLYKLLSSSSRKGIAYEFWDVLGFAEFIFGKRKTEDIKIDPKFSLSPKSNSSNK